MYASVIVDITHEAVDKTFQYRIPSKLEPAVFVGSLLNVPFGRGNNLKKAYVLELSETPEIDPRKIKDIDSVFTGEVSIEDELVILALWMAETYGSTMASALRTVLPVAKKTAIPVKRIITPGKSKEELSGYLLEYEKKVRPSVARIRLLSALLKEDKIPWEAVTGKLNIPSQTIRDMEKKGLLNVEDEKKSYAPKEEEKKPPVTLNPEQQAAYDAFLTDYEAGKRGTYLLYGVTGSGKTEVYIRMIEKVVSAGKQAIVLIPEIALTYQTLMRFYNRFGEKVSIMNSRLSDGERFDIFSRARKGEISIIIGPRSALFTPFLDLGLIIIDEEHESSYKSEKMPRYHARETAIKRAELSGASLILGSATPSVESFYRARRGDFKLLSLKKRTGSATLPSCEVVDLRVELMAGNRSVLSRRLYSLIKETLSAGNQVMLFINRRGVINSLSCRACGEVVKCPHCDVALTLHRNGRLLCHYCGHEEPALKACPSCGSTMIGGFKAGTERIEELLKREFPGAGVIRMDADSTKGKDGHEKILSVFANRGADIMIGTQMIVKGHDFPGVTLVGILAADLSLNDSDFRCSERTFDLITQAAGRAGRGLDAGRVVIQTYRPDHYAVSFAAASDYESFYNEEIRYRSLLSYPPVGHMQLIMILSRRESEALKCGEEISAVLKEKFKGVFINGPISPYVGKIQDIYRRLIYIKSEDLNLLFKMRKAAKEVYKDNKAVSVYFDLDPLGM